MRLYNTLSHQIDAFEPIDPKNVRIYTCGPTVYGPVHIGNLRTYTVGDILVRALRNQGYKVIHVENITDVDDKTIRESQKAGLLLYQYTQKFIDSYFDDLSTLNIVKPDQSPRATDPENITAMIEMISSLIGSDHAYKTDDGVYYRISSDPEYGKLAGKVGHSLEGPTFRSRIKNDEYEKEAAADFALWKFQTPEDGDIDWDSPFGKGRPGWHIECSAMIHRLLGEPIDIHAGGTDLIFPHHTNETAQTKSAFGHQVANIWLHNEFIQVEGKKMSKSLGNIITLDKIKEKGVNLIALRYLYLTTHYRQKQNFTWEALAAAQTALDKLIDFLAINDARSGPTATEYVAVGPLHMWQKKFMEIVNDDLNMPQALAVVWELVKDSSLSNANKQATIFDFDKVLGLDLQKQVEARQKEVLDIPAEIKRLIDDREEARKNKDFKKSDELREKVKNLGYTVEDSENGPIIKPT